MVWQLRSRLHPVWFLTTAAGAFMGGVVLAGWWPGLLGPAWAWLGGLLLLAALVWRRGYLIVAAVAGGLLLGLWRGAVSLTDLTVYRPLQGQAVVIDGVVADDVDTAEDGTSSLRLHNLIINGQSYPGTAWVHTTAPAQVKRGDQVQVSGRVAPGFGGFAVALWRARILAAHHPTPGDLARQVRDWFADAVRLAIPSPEADLGIGYLVGQRRTLPDDLATALQATGLTHIVVASGYNLTILVRFMRRWLAGHSRYLATVGTGAMVLAFIAITGLSPSMVRAGMVAGLALAAWYYGRRFHPVVLLLLTAAASVAVHPAYLYGDVGWMLSFTAFAGVMILAPLLQAYFFGDKPPGTLRQIAGETLAAWVVTAPLLVSTFGSLSLVALVANLLVLPLVPLAMALTAVAGVGALLAPLAAPAVGLLGYWLLHYMVTVAMALGDLPWATIPVTMPVWATVVCYVGLVVVTVYLRWATGRRLDDHSIIE